MCTSWKTNENSLIILWWCVAAATGAKLEPKLHPSSDSYLTVIILIQQVYYMWVHEQNSSFSVGQRTEPSGNA